MGLRSNVSMADVKSPPPTQSNPQRLLQNVTGSHIYHIGKTLNFAETLLLYKSITIITK
jgi:hypothetical protein